MQVAPLGERVLLSQPCTWRLSPCFVAFVLQYYISLLMAEHRSDVRSLPRSSSPVADAPALGQRCARMEPQQRPWSNAYYRSLCRPPSVPLSPQSQLLPLGNSLHLPEFLHSGRLPSSVFQSIPVPHKFNPIMHVCSRSQSSHNDAATAQIAASLDLQSTPYSAVPCYY